MRGLPRIYNSDLLQKDILCFYMVMMSVQIIALEGMTISPLKAGAMALSFPILFCLLTRSRRDITVLFLVCSYWIVLICCSLMSSSVVSWDRIIYRAMFLSTFVCHYHIVRSEAVDISFVRKLFAVIICAYGVSFVLQCFFFTIKEYIFVQESHFANRIHPYHQATSCNYITIRTNWRQHPGIYIQYTQ